jgi:hypothetical protein
MTAWSKLDVAEDSHLDERGRARDLDLDGNHTSPKLQMQLVPPQVGPPSSPRLNHRVHCSESVNEPTRLTGASACLKSAQDQSDYRTIGPLYLLFFAMQHQWPLPR